MYDLFIVSHVGTWWCWWAWWHGFGPLEAARVRKES